MKQEQKIDLSHYVSNLDKNVYTIFNLPEEVIAVIFAYVSRSSASFRDNLRKLLSDEELNVNLKTAGAAKGHSEKAARFHEKWVVGYGHSSVAEHAVAHIGIEKISRLASAELELSNPFNSFTEYSQRYQRPKRGDFYVPPVLEQNPGLKEKFLSLQDKAYDTYEQLLSGLTAYLVKVIPQKPEESERAYRMRIEKIAFEDARYVLTLATFTNLGMTGNGRALRDTLVRLLSSPYDECRKLAKEMEREISQVIPTLLKYVKPNDYLLHTRKKLKELFFEQTASLQPVQGPRARMVHIPDYEEALTELVTRLIISETALSYEQAHQQARSYSREQKEQIAETALSELRFFDNPRWEFEHIHYQFELLISEANWHQLLRHNRRTHFSHGLPTIHLGYTIPPHIREAGLEERYQSFLHEAENVYQDIESWNPEAAAYVVTNAHHRQVTATASLWELYHLINLRTSPEAQWDIRQTFLSLFEELKNHHPALAKYAQRRINN
ncbi:FAD-dependent thymidylate synthase [Thermoactinomyces vulgaris]|jgi:flavin-dependent thymidylate synthase|uniref:FAD-dependent thymidylate synthase n=1 Tax=Thermoactinomyces vulgaris TaxID=2026 RepID=A0ABS0QII9_THEVU|nr:MULTISPECIES: FAD-dependent thymidylate synthase [Thermoactinomyces]MBA4552141.1 FAD-dependent thymidylate synthase [Thermoactinomyces vulgaris]MBA4597369.1 FAD-dependent thymidylate synthase [Thermoactinomyces vulgaris]MBH8584214.1 FAD-dependent thymidylate synthase [Thermoactinomyces sp. CICC 10735]MBH8589085.1 FAD-dependent thymidylate synthase [Thermoactinomyces vulgaris]MBI0392390.1 FAD-dependent thymidylate synthase [Thermoactinomyces sp. CICC 24226]